MKRLLLLFLVLIMSCNNVKTINVQGHRGCRGLFPENSLPAFEKAIDLGVHTLELDLAISKDKKVVVSHEPYMSRVFCLDPQGNEISKTDDMRYNLYEMTHEEIKEFDCGTKFHNRFPEQEKLKVYKPLLSEVFQMAESKNSNITYNIEIKSKPKYDGKYTPSPKEFVYLVLEVINQYGVFDRTNLQSFDLRVMEEIHKQTPEMKTALLIDEDEDIIAKLNKLTFKPEIISPYYKLLSETKVKDLQSNNFLVIPWTVNEIEDMQQMINYHVDGIITDYPDKLIKLVGN